MLTYTGKGRTSEVPWEAALHKSEDSLCAASLLMNGFPQNCHIGCVFQYVLSYFLSSIYIIYYDFSQGRTFYLLFLNPTAVSSKFCFHLLVVSTQYHFSDVVTSDSLLSLPFSPLILQSITSCLQENSVTAHIILYCALVYTSMLPLGMTI